MKKLKIFALAASLLQAALFSAFAANPPSDFIYDLTDDNKAVKITGLRNDKAEYVIPANIEDFPVTDVVIRYDEDCNITLPEGCLNVFISRPHGYGYGTITVNQLPSSVKKLELYDCYYNGTLPTEIEDVSIDGDGGKIKLNQDSSGLKNLKKLAVTGKSDAHINFPYDLSESQNLESLELRVVDVTNKAPLKLESLKKLDLDGVNLIGNKTVYTKDASSLSRIGSTNIEELIFEEGVTNIRGEYAYNNENLTKVVLPSTLKEIGRSAFTDCPNLSEVVVPDSLGKIETNGNKLRDVFDTTSLSLKNRIKLKEAFGFSK